MTSPCSTEKFCELFRSSLSDALKQFTGAGWQISEAPSSDAPQHGAVQIYRIHLEGNFSGELFLELPRTQIASVAARLSQGQEPVGDSPQQAFYNILRESLRLLEARLAEAFGAINLRIETASEVQASLTRITPLIAQAPGWESLSLLIYLPRQLMDAFGSTNANAPSSKTEGTGTPMDANLSLIMDVELNLTLRFGQRKLPLSEVLGLAGGSIIELDRQVDEPVELLLGDKVIARGEAVIVDGNYGLRVTEVPQPIAPQLTR